MGFSLKKLAKSAVKSVKSGVKATAKTVKGVTEDVAEKTVSAVVTPVKTAVNVTGAVVDMAKGKKSFVDVLKTTVKEVNKTAVSVKNVAVLPVNAVVKTTVNAKEAVNETLGTTKVGKVIAGINDKITQSVTVPDKVVKNFNSSTEGVFTGKTSVKTALKSIGGTALEVSKDVVGVKGISALGQKDSEEKEEEIEAVNENVESKSENNLENELRLSVKTDSDVKTETKDKTTFKLPRLLFLFLIPVLFFYIMG